MLRPTALRQAFQQHLLAFEPRTCRIAAARSMVAVAELTILFFNSDELLFTIAPSAPQGLRCDGIAAVSLWCLGGTGGGAVVARSLSVAVLVLVAIGYRPRLTCLPHWYVAFGISASLPFSNGGDHVAQILAMLLIPACLGDDRVWQWHDSRAAMPGRWRGAAYAAQLVLRLQIAWIYLQAALSKVAYPEWRDGTAMPALAQHPSYGFPPFLVDLTEGGWFHLLTVATWAAVAAELTVGLLILGGRRARRWALGLGIVLHGFIFVAMGLASFELIMIALLLAGGGYLFRADQIVKPAGSLLRTVDK